MYYIQYPLPYKTERNINQKKNSKQILNVSIIYRKIKYNKKIISKENVSKLLYSQLPSSEGDETENT